MNLKLTQRITYLLLAFLSCYSGNSQEYKQMMNNPTSYSVQEIVDEAERYFSDKDKGRGSGYKQFKRWEHIALKMMDETGYLKTNNFYFEELERYNKYRNRRENVNFNDAWEEIGPTNWNQTSGWNPGVGRLTSFAVDRSNINHIIVGSDVGGVWKTLDEGVTWTPLTDNHNNMDVYALAMDPVNNDTYYWGSTDGRIYKSTDGGSTWTLAGNAANTGRINKILIHPTTTTTLFASNSENGFYKSIDGGASWDLVVFDGRAQDIEFKSDDTNIMLFSGTKVFRSTDLGVSTTEVGNFGAGAKMLGVTPADANRVYVLEEDGGIFGGFYVSEDAGATFTKKSHLGKNYFGYSSNADDNRGQAPRDMDVVASTTDANEVHIAGILTWRSTDGGDTFSITSQWIPQSAASENIGYCHADVDIMEMINDKLYVGSDGGIFIADDIKNVSSNYYRDITSGMGVRAFYKIGVSQTNPPVIVGGAQDNGTSTFTSTQGWTDWLGADGMECFVDKDDSSKIYGTIQFGGMFKSNDGGVNISGINAPFNKQGNWITPFEQDPKNTDVIYVGYDEVYKSEDAGANWISISQNFGINLNHLKIAPSNNEIMYAAISSSLYKKESGSTTWTLLTNLLGRINSIAIHPKDPQKIAVATNSGDKVHVSTDGGQTWTSFRKNLPDFSSLAVVWQDNGEDGLYVGMNYGVFYIDNTLSEWESYSNNLPNVRILELEINTADEKIYAATYGRGCWSSPIKNSTLSVNDNELSNAFTMYPNPVEDMLFLKSETIGTSSLRLFNSQGQLVYFSKNQNLQETVEIPTKTFTPGVYFLRLSTGKGEATKKVVIK